MIKKIFVTILSLFLFCFLAVDIVYASTPCENEGATRCIDGHTYQECEGFIWSEDIPCPDGQNCDDDTGACEEPPDGGATNTPVPPTDVPCGALNYACTQSSQCCSGYTCCAPTVDGTGRCMDECDCRNRGYYGCRAFCLSAYPEGGHANLGCWVTKDCVPAEPEFMDAPHQEFDVDVGTVVCPAGNDENYCSAIFCYNAPNEDICPGFNPANPPCNGPGNCDDCGGVDCGWCGGVDPDTITPTPGCVANCLDQAANPCVAQTCVGSSCQSTCPGIFCNGTKRQAQTCTGSGIQFIETPQHTGTIWARIYGVSANADSVKFPTWSSLDGWDDGITWYDGSKDDSSCSSNCTWGASINLDNHNVNLADRWVNVHSYISGCGTTNSPCATTGGFTISEKTCSVGVTKTGDRTFTVTVSADGALNPGSQTGNLWVEKANGSEIENYATQIIPSAIGYSSSGNYYYKFSSAILNSTDSVGTSKTIDVILPGGGDYYFHCDMPDNITDYLGGFNYVQCSGNPRCSYENKLDVGTTLACNNWKSCSGSDNSRVCSEGETCALQCGQNRDCNPNCGAGETGVPGVPVIDHPAGTALNPVILRGDRTGTYLYLAGPADKADSYFYGVYDDGASFTWVGSSSLSVGITGLTSGNLYSWRARAVNDTCAPYNEGVAVTSAASNFGYFRVNTPPVIGAFSIHNFEGAEVPKEAGSRNHICQSDFNGSRSVNFRLSVTDIDGPNDIAEVLLNWGGQTYHLLKGSTWATGAMYSTTINYEDQSNPNTYEITATVRDNFETVSGGTGRNWKVWNCQVPVSGHVYDGSADHSCSGGFNTLADSDMGFRDLEFYNSSGSVTATVTEPNAFGTNDLIWGKSYMPYINDGTPPEPNGDLAATGRMTKFLGSGIPGLGCPSDDQIDIGDIDAYGDSPTATVDFSFIRDQESWYQVRGGGVRAGNIIESGVPVTADTGDRYLTLGRSFPTTIDNGLVSYVNRFININGYNEEAYGSPNSWWKEGNLLPVTRYGYQYFYKNLYIGAGVGVTGTAWDEKPSEGVFFVNGDLNIDSNFTLADNKFFMVVVSGDLTIANGVTRLDGIYVSDGELAATGNASNEPLIINGMLFSRNSIRLGRSFADKFLNNSAPATIVNYRPSLLFNMPVKLSKIISGWRED